MYVMQFYYSTGLLNVIASPSLCSFEYQDISIPIACNFFLAATSHILPII